jgi:RHS repeat-associated protein
MPKGMSREFRNNQRGTNKMKTLRFLILGLLVTATTVCHAQITDPGWFVAQPQDNQTSGVQIQTETSQVDPQGNPMFRPLGLQVPANPPAIAEAITPQIQALAQSLQTNNWANLFSYVQQNIRYVPYFGSKKGAQLTLLEKSGNDFDQCALLVALLRAGGYTNVEYQFGWQFIPYDDPFGSQVDLHHLFQLNLSNTNWNYTSNYVGTLLSTRGYPLYFTSGTNYFLFQRVRVALAIGSNTNFLDPSFKISEPITNILNLSSALGFSSNNIMSAAGGTATTNYVSGLNEVNLGNTLTGYATNLFNTIQSNYPNATMQQILSGWYVPSQFTLPSFSPGQVYNAFATNGTVTWINEPTNLMTKLSITFAGTNYQCWMPQLEGQRLSLTFDTNGLAQLWQDDTLLASNTASGTSSTTNVVVSINQPFGYWDITNGVIIPTAFDDQIVTNTYQRTNATYALIYAFEPDWSWLQQRENKLDAYRQQGLADTSRQVVSETLNVMGLNWMLQTEGAEQMLAAQEGILPQYHDRFGRMAQESGKGYYVDVYMQLSGELSASGADTANSNLQNRHLALVSYFDSALENGIIEQLQSSNIVASSTVKMLELANTNGQAVYLASSANWSTVQGSLVNYNTSSLNSTYIIPGYYLLLPQNGSNHIAGAGSWAGYGIEARHLTSTNETITMLISGGYNGGYSPYPTLTINVQYVDLTGDNQPPSVAVSPPATPDPSIADPIDAANGTFQVEHTDLSLGQTEPRGITLSRYYNGTRRYSNPAGMAPGWIHNYYVNANTVAAPQAALGGTTPAQAVSMMVATCAAIGIYNDSQPDPKNWMVTALIAKWGIDQVTKSGVSVNLGKDLLQFVRQPNGVFTPPLNTTLTLTQKANGNYSLQERHGRTFTFNALGSLTNIADQYGNSLTLGYTNNMVATVTDWKGRSFTFNYNTSNQLASVSDGTRSVSYGYTGGDLTSVTDPENKTSTYLYDTNHEITATFDALNQLVVSNVYDGLGHVSMQYTEGNTNKAWQIFWSGIQTIEVDPAGGTSTYFYDNQSRLTGVQDPLGHLPQTVYDNQNHVVETISPLNEINQSFYDGNNNLIKTIDPLNSTNQFIYDGNNNLVQSVDGRGNVSTFGYNTNFSLIGQTNGAGDYVNYAYNTDGTLASRTDSGGTTAYTYDSTYRQLVGIGYPGSLGSESFANNSLGDVTSHTDANGNTTTYTYNKRRQLLVTTAPTNLVTTLGYDAVGNLQTNIDARGNVSTNSWSPTRKLLSTTLPATAQGVPVESSAYDARDLMIQTLDPLNNSTQFTNDLAGRLIAASDPLSRTARMGYDADGRNLATTNAAGEVTKQQWNKRGQLSITTDNANHTVKRGYDAAGDQIALTNRNTHVWQFQFDAANRLISTISPLGYSNVLAFNHQGLVQTMVDQIGRTTTYGYDGKGRLTSRADNVATTTYAYDANNNPTSVLESGNTNSWTYDAYNRVSSCKDIYGNLIQYKYDGNGNVTNLVYPGGKNVYYTFDSNNHLTQVTDWSGRTTTIAYDLAGHLTSITRPNGTVRTIAYDKDGEATNIIEEAASKYPIAFYTLGWTNSGRVAWEFGAPLPHTNAPPSRTMTYDFDNRLATFKLGTSSTLTVGSDADGNLTNAPLTTNALAAYSYDARNRLLNVGGVTNFYDAMNNRYLQTQGTNATMLVVNPNAKLPQVLMRIKNGVTNYYVYGAGLLYQVTETASGTNVLTYHYDYRGSTVALTDTNGNITDRIEYSLYAMTTYRAGTNDTPFLFNGRYGVMTDPNGLLYMRARYYNPYLCRFVNPDPSGFKGGLNFYAAFNGNPVSYLDPSGLGAVGDDNNLSWLTGASATPTDLSNPFSIGTGNSSLNFQTASTGLNIAGIAQLGAEYGSGNAVLGLYNSSATSSGLYFNSSFFGGNQYVDTMRVSDIAHGFGVGLFYLSAGLEVYGYQTGQESGTEAFRQINAGVIGLVGGPIGAAVGVTYGLFHEDVNGVAAGSFQILTDWYYQAPFGPNFADLPENP